MGDFNEPSLEGAGPSRCPPLSRLLPALHPASKNFFSQDAKISYKSHKTSQDCETFFYVRWWTFATTGKILIPSLFILTVFLLQKRKLSFFKKQENNSNEDPLQLTRWQWPQTQKRRTKSYARDKINAKAPQLQKQQRRRRRNDEATFQRKRRNYEDDKRNPLPAIFGQSSYFFIYSELI